jgi:hypothetical protein
LTADLCIKLYDGTTGWGYKAKRRGINDKRAKIE